MITEDTAKEILEDIKKEIGPTVARPEMQIEAERYLIKAGTVEIDLNEIGYGTVMVDGKSIPATEITFHTAVHEAPRLTITMLCLKP